MDSEREPVFSPEGAAWWVVERTTLPRRGSPTPEAVVVWYCAAPPGFTARPESAGPPTGEGEGWPTAAAALTYLRRAMAQPWGLRPKRTVPAARAARLARRPKGKC